MTKIDLWYLFGKPWHISVWSQKSKKIAWLLTVIFLGQSTLKSYHKKQIVPVLLHLETVPKKMSQMFLIIAQFPLVFRQNWIKYTKLFRFQALKWGTVCFFTLSKLRDIAQNVQKMFFRFYTFCKKKICQNFMLKFALFLLHFSCKNID